MVNVYIVTLHSGHKYQLLLLQELLVPIAIDMVLIQYILV